MNREPASQDEVARRQIRELLEQNFLVEAGAGTGKTSALVDRVAALVLGGQKIDRIVAITFTEKAAAELRDRVRSALEDLRAGPGLDGERAALVSEALGALDRAQISTIHAFCHSLLRRYAPELGLDPGFDVQDEVMADRRFEEVWRLRLESLGRDDEAREAVNRALDLGLSVKDIASLARSLWTESELAPLLKERPLSAPNVDWPDLGRALERLAALQPQRVAPEDRLRSRIEMLIAALAGLRQSTEDREARLAALAGQLSQSFTVGRRENWGGAEGVGRARELCQQVADDLGETLARLRSQALAALLPLVVDFVLDDTKERGREGKLVFDDLILRVRDLLRDRPDARRSLRERFDCLLIDEFQDTDPLQVEIGWSFAANPETGELEPGRLFLVGDPKQSIYRFRRADMAVYARTRLRVQEQDGLLPTLSRNRRSRRAIVEWVNHVFNSVIGETDDAAVQPPYAPLEHERDEVLLGPGAGWFGGGGDKNARDLRADEANELARQVCAAVDGAWEVWDWRAGVARPAQFRDMAVLVPTRAILLPLERALAAFGVPHRVEGGSLIYGTQEVRDVINCLTAIDDPADEIAIVAALRSPAYACSDVELAEFKLAGGGFQYLRGGLAGRVGRVAEALRDLLRLHRLRHDRSLASLVEGFLGERGLAEVSILDQGSRNGFRRARFLVEQARVFEGQAPESLRAFVTWLERRAGEAVLDNEGAGLDDDEDAIRVLTIHAAKGLEFPIVFVAGLGVSPPAENRVFGLDRETGEISVKLGAASRGGYFTLGPVEQITAQEKRHLRAERDRLLYVAATRARDHLVLSLYHRASSRDSAAARLIERGAREAASEVVVPAVVVRERRASLPTVEAEDLVPLEGFEERREALVRDSRRQLLASATGLALERSDETEPWARGRGGTHVGRAVHAALQSLAWDAASDEIGAVARAQAVAEAIPERAGEVARLVGKALGSSAAGRGREGRRTLREVPFALPLDGVLVEGFVDVVIESEDGLEIIDWKTDDVSAEHAAERLRQYELQAGLYAMGIEAATGRPVGKLTYVFIRPAVELSPGEPAVLIERARARLREGEGLE